MTRPVGAWCSSVARISPIQTRSVASKTASSRLDDVSSGPTRRKVDGIVADDVAQPRAQHAGRFVDGRALARRRGRRTTRKSGSRRSRRRSPPFAWGFALIRRVPTGAMAVTLGSGRPSASNSSSGRYERSQASSWARWLGLPRTSESGT